MATSQLSYTSGYHASGSYSQPMTTVSAGIFAFDFDTTGANITWDYNLLGMDLSGRKYTVTPASSGYQAPFITQCILSGGGFTCLTKWNRLTNLGMVDLDSLNAVVFTLYDVMTMAKKSSSHLIGNIKGLKIKDTNGLTVPVVTEYANADTIFTFPFTYQDSGKSYAQWGLDLNSIGQNIQYKVTYDRNWVVEGWGKLITPYQTHHNVLKVKTTLNQVDSVIFMTTPFGIPRKIVEYTWYDANFGLPIMKAEGIESIGIVTITSVQYYDTRIVGLSEDSKESIFSVYPNPTSSILNIVNTNKNVVAYRIVDIQGKIIITSKISNSINVDSYPSGIYMIQLLNESNSVIDSQKFVKE
mgnify:FL=1